MQYSHNVAASLPQADMYPAFYAANSNEAHPNMQALKSQLLEQWQKLTPLELEATGYNLRGIALLVQRKYGIASQLVENYLRNFERTMPEFGI